MAQTRQRFSARGFTLRTTCALVVCGCASAPPTTTPRTAVRLEPLKEAPAERTPEPLPVLPAISGGGAISDRTPRVTSLQAVGQDLRDVIRVLAEQAGVQYRIEPGVSGTVNTTLRNKTLTEALDAIMPQGVTYQIEQGVLRVGPARMQTKIFSLDYVALSRVGTASTIIQRRLGAGLGASGIGSGFSNPLAAGAGGQSQGLAGAGALAGGADVINAISVADAWEEIRVTAEALIFDATPGTTQASGSGPLGLGTVGRPYSRVSADGRRLILNPMAGTITASAFPAQLEQLEISIRTFEASVQRQVLIEAKIVEVNLDRTYEFGIDWNVIASGSANGLGTGSIDVRSSTAPPRANNNVKLTLTGGSGSITVVLNALESQGDVRVLSSPRVSALNNQRAVFDVTTGEIVFNVTQTPILNPGGIPTFVSQVTPQQVNVGIVLDVLAQIGADNVVTMNIRPVVTSVRNTATFNGPDGTVFQAPVIDTRESDTMARMRGGETIIIGGLMQTRREKVRSGIPVLRSVPLIGWLFRTDREVERKAELVIFLTPTIIAGQPAAGR